MDKNFCLSFPQLAENIFKNLDDQNLKKSKKISRLWNRFLKNPKFVLIRKIKMIVETRRKFRKPWKTVCKTASTSTIQDLEIATRKFFANDWNFGGDPETISKANF